MTANANLFARFEAGFDRDACFLESAHTPTHTYRDLDQWSARAANTLVELGLNPGDRVSVIAEKSIGLLWLFLGCLRAGCVYHPLNPAYTENELSFFLTDAEPRLVICDPALASRVGAASIDCSELERVLTLDPQGQGSLVERWRDADPNFDTIVSSTEDLAALLYSSGTTGRPKGIPLTHGNLYTNAVDLMQTWGFSKSDVLLHVLPIYHVHGLFVVLGPALLAGMRVRFFSRFDAEAVAEALPGATVMAGVPTYYSRLLHSTSFSRDTCDGVRVFISGSAPLSEETFRRFHERTGHTILERYGMTETGINTSNPLSGARKPGSVGLPLPGVALRITDDGGASLKAREIGNVEVQGGNVFCGYWRLPETHTEAFTSDGFFRTGDQGYLDDDGYLFIVGRSKDMIISGGLNVYPKEVEREIESFAAVDEVAVFGVPHDDYGEAVVAVVVERIGAQFDEADAIGALKVNLAGYKVPKRILVINEIPVNSMGKVQKSRLRDRFNDLFGYRTTA